MNRSLLAFAIILLFGGLYLGVSFVVVLGIFFLIPALFTTPKKPTRVPVSRTQQPQRPSQRAPQRAPAPSMPQAASTDYSPAMPAQVQAPVPMPPTTPAPSISMSTSTGLSYSPPLFPTSILPPTGQLSTYRQQPTERKENAPGREDELIEIGVVLAVLKLAFG